jgi:hypothetical protein
MPLTPFVGLSIMVHIVVIVGHRLFHWTPMKPESRKENVVAFVRFLGFGIIGAVFAVVLISATVLVRASVKDKHSSIRFMGEVAENTYASFFFPRTLPPAVIHNLTATLADKSTRANRQTMFIPEQKTPSQAAASGITADSSAAMQQWLEIEKGILLDMQAKLSSPAQPTVLLDH